MTAETNSPPPNTDQPEAWLRARSERRFLLVDRQLTTALVVSGVVLAAVLYLWLLGKLSWNHEPQVSQQFQPATTAVLTNRPQNAALEFHHALNTGRYIYAKNLAAPALSWFVDETAQKCGPNCPTPERTTGEVFTRATLLTNNGRTATVFVESLTKNSEPIAAATYDVLRETDHWLVLSLASPSALPAQTP